MAIIMHHVSESPSPSQSFSIPSIEFDNTAVFCENPTPHKRDRNARTDVRNKEQNLKNFRSAQLLRNKHAHYKRYYKRYYLRARYPKRYKYRLFKQRRYMHRRLARIRFVKQHAEPAKVVPNHRRVGIVQLNVAKHRPYGQDNGRNAEYANPINGNSANR